MKRLTLTLTKEQSEKIKKTTGVNISKLRLVPPAKAEETKALRAQALPKKALRAQALPKKALRAMVKPTPTATPLFESIPVPPTVR